QGALKNVGHRVGRSTIARILKANGLPPVPERPTSWQTFLRAHKDAIAGADFFTTEVWTWRGLVTMYTVFVIQLASRRVQILGSTPHPDEAFMRQVGRTLTMADAETCRVLICDRDAKWNGPFQEMLRAAGIRVVHTPYRAPNAMPMRKGFCDPSRENASTGSFRWASAIFGGRCRNTWRITILNGIIKGSGTRSSMAPRPEAWVRFAADRAWADCSITTSVRRDGQFGCPLGHYELRQGR